MPDPNDPSIYLNPLDPFGFGEEEERRRSLDEERYRNDLLNPRAIPISGHDEFVNHATATGFIPNVPGLW